MKWLNETQVTFTPPDLCKNFNALAYLLGFLQLFNIWQKIK